MSVGVLRVKPRLHRECIPHSLIGSMLMIGVDLSQQSPILGYYIMYTSNCSKRADSQVMTH